MSQVLLSCRMRAGFQSRPAPLTTLNPNGHRPRRFCSRGWFLPLADRESFSCKTHTSLSGLGPLPQLALGARMRLFFGLCSTSANPSASSTGGKYMPKRPRRPFFQAIPAFEPGLLLARPQASTVPSAAGFCFVGAAEQYPVAVLLQHLVEVVDGAQLVAELRFCRLARRALAASAASSL